MTGISQFAADWLLTWVVHATVASVLTLAAGRWLIADPRLRELLWKAALLLPMATSLVAVGLHPITPSALELVKFARSHLPDALGSAHVSVQATGVLADTTTIRVQDPLSHWLGILILGATLTPALVGVSRLVQRRRKFRAQLRSRRSIDARSLGVGAWPLWLAKRAARISMSPHVVSAAVVGRREICVSPAFTMLGPAERCSVLAHEMAHLARRDPAWIAFADAVACALAAQPLVGLVARRFRRDAEFICDEIAVRQTGNAVAYVRALTHFANEKHASVPAAALAYGSSPIVQRAERVLGLHGWRRPPRTRITFTCVAAIVLLAALLSLPRVKTGAPSSRVRAHVSREVGRMSPPQAHLTIRLDVP